MSIHASSVIFFNSDFKNIADKINFSFEVQRLANINKISVNQGGNIQSHTLKEINFIDGESCNEYIIEIADDPLDFNAEYIFGGYDFDLDGIDEFDRFENRILRMKNFLISILNIPIVKGVKLFINISVGDKYEYICTNISKFDKVLIDLFINANGWTPRLYVKILNN